MRVVRGFPTSLLENIKGPGVRREAEIEKREVGLRFRLTPDELSLTGLISS
jgi:hypothetical protein